MVFLLYMVGASFTNFMFLVQWSASCTGIWTFAGTVLDVISSQYLLLCHRHKLAPEAELEHAHRRLCLQVRVEKEGRVHICTLYCWRMQRWGTVNIVGAEGRGSHSC